MTVEKKKLARRGIKVIFYLYIIGIFYFVLLSERYGRDTGYDTSHVNLVLFKEINRFWTYRHLLSTEAVEMCIRDRSERIYKCECGNVVDRDLQAALNLKKYGEDVLKRSVA